MRFFLDIKVLQRSDGIYICQRKYALEILKRFGIFERNSVNSPIVPGCKINKDEDGITVDETYHKQLVGELDISHSHKTEYDVCHLSHK